MQIKPQTLVVAIGCVAAEIKLIDQLLQHNEPDNAADLEQLLVSFDLAAADLKAAYEVALTQYGELPTYEKLVQ